MGIAGLRPRVCVDGAQPVVIRVRDESRFLARIKVDRRKIKTSRRHRIPVRLDPTELARGRHSLTVTGTDAAGNRSRRERTFRVCKF